MPFGGPVSCLLPAIFRPSADAIIVILDERLGVSTVLEIAINVRVDLSRLSVFIQIEPTRTESEVVV
jgi:hypothetical protein